MERGKVSAGRRRQRLFEQHSDIKQRGPSVLGNGDSYSVRRSRRQRGVLRGGKRRERLCVRHSDIKRRGPSDGDSVWGSGRQFVTRTTDRCAGRCKRYVLSSQRTWRVGSGAIDRRRIERTGQSTAKTSLTV